MERLLTLRCGIPFQGAVGCGLVAAAADAGGASQSGVTGLLAGVVTVLLYCWRQYRKTTVEIRAREEALALENEEARIRIEKDVENWDWMRSRIDSLESKVKRLRRANPHRPHRRRHADAGSHDETRAPAMS